MRNYGEPELWSAVVGLGAAIVSWRHRNGIHAGGLQCHGIGGQFITVLPINDMVVVHQVDIDKNPSAGVSPSSYMAILSMIANAKCAGECK